MLNIVAFSVILGTQRLGSGLPDFFEWRRFGVRVEGIGMTMPFDPQQFSEAMKALRGIAMPDEVTVQGLRSNAHRMRKMLQDIAATQEHLVQLEGAILSYLDTEAAHAAKSEFEA